jgi:restriction system protein
MDSSYETTMKPWYQRGQQDAPAAPQPANEVVEEIASASRLAIAAHTLATLQLKEDLLGRIYCQSFRFFESLVLDLLLAMGYAGRRRDLVRHLGRSHDGGVDGVIELDELGLDAIYVQAKRLKPGSTVPVAEIRNFIGSLEANRSTKGVFLTTGQFTIPAEHFIRAVHHRVALADGNKLTELMIRHNVGVAAGQSYQTKTIINSYFTSGRS